MIGLGASNQPKEEYKPKEHYPQEKKAPSRAMEILREAHAK